MTALGRPSNAPTSAIVVGGGVVGLCVACSLQAAGVQTRLFDPQESAPPASWGNAGHLATEHVEPMASPRTLLRWPAQTFLFGGPLDFVWSDIGAWLPWALRFVACSTPQRFAAGVRILETMACDSIPAWRRLLGGDADDLLRQQGHLVVWEGAAADAGLEAAVAASRDRFARFEACAVEEAAALSQRLRLGTFRAAHVCGSGQVADPGRLLRRLEELFVRQGGQMERIAAVALAPEAEGARHVLLADGRRASASVVVVAAGVGSRPLLASADLFAPLIAERGYHVMSSGAGWPADLSPVVFASRSVVLTRFDGGLRATSFTEFGRPTSAPDPRKWRRLERHLRDLGVLAPDEPVTRWMGSRPTLPDYLPAIGGGETAGLYYAIGHSHLGLTLAALTGELIRDLVLRPAAVRIDLRPLSLRRFASSSTR